MTQTTPQPSIPQYFHGYVQDGKIFHQSYEGIQQVGVTSLLFQDLQRVHKELMDVCEAYKTRLIELGEIEIPLTQDQIIQQQAALLKENQELMKTLAAQVEALTKAKEPEDEHTLPVRRDRKKS